MTTPSSRRRASIRTSTSAFFGTDVADYFTKERVDTTRDACPCLIDGVRCLAREAYFGGIVVQPEQT